jgi:hypothetical protein
VGTTKKLKEVTSCLEEISQELERPRAESKSEPMKSWRRRRGVVRSIDAPVWDVRVFTKNRERRLSGDVATQLLSAVLDQPRVRVLLSDEYFSVDGTLIEAWASLKSLQPKDGSGAPPRA